MAEVQIESARRRRRKSSRKKPVTWREYWRSAEFGRHLFAAMSLIGAAYAGTVLWETRFASYNYPPVKIGMTPSEVRYLLGSPRTVEAGGSLYRYSEKGREVAVRFSSSGRMVSIACRAGAQGPPTCPRIRGIGIGTGEYDVLRQLGGPSRETFHGDAKTMYYDGMGMVFQLSLLEVTQVELRKGGGFTGYFPRALFAMVP